MRYEAPERAGFPSLALARLPACPSKSRVRRLERHRKAAQGIPLALRTIRHFAYAIVSNCHTMANKVTRKRLNTWRPTRAVRNGVEVHPSKRFDVARHSPVTVFGNFLSLKDTIVPLSKAVGAASICVSNGAGRPENSAARRRKAGRRASPARRTLCLAPARVPPSPGQVPVCRYAFTSGGFASAPGEAMSCGSPTKAACVESISGIIANGVCGLIVPARDPEAEAFAIKRRESRADHRSRLGHAGWERSVRYTSRACRKLHVVVFKEVPAPRRVRRARPEADSSRGPQVAARHVRATLSLIPRLLREDGHDVRHCRLS
jgi:hypothetical protein